MHYPIIFWWYYIAYQSSQPHVRWPFILFLPKWYSFIVIYVIISVKIENIQWIWDVNRNVTKFVAYIITGFHLGFPYGALLDTLYFALFMSCYYLSTVPVCDCTSLSSSTAAALDAFLLAVASWPNFWLAALILAALRLVCLWDILVWEGDFFLLCSYKSEKLWAPDVVEAYNILIII